MTDCMIDGDSVAYLEPEGWRAYDDHTWPLLLRLMIQVSHGPFRMPWPAAVLEV